MKRSAYITLATFLAFGVSVVAQDAGKTAIGPVKSVSGTFFTVDANKTTLKFTVDANTSVHAKGATSTARAKKEAGAGGVTIVDVIHEGDQVLVKYADVGGKLLASEVEVRRPRPASAQPVK